MECKLCEQIKANGKEMIFQDERIAVLLSTHPASLGHLIVLPKEHYTILEQVPDGVLAEMFIIANKLSIIIFETLNAHGTNVIVQNGVAAGQTENHFSIHVIPRRQNDGLNFEWQAEKASEDALKTAQLKYEPYTKNLLISAEAPTEQPAEQTEQKTETIKEQEGKTNYLLSNLDRIP
jgi:histidine triad (HIT) family protein